MRPSDVDWSVLRRPLVMLLISLLISGGVLAGGYYYAERMEQEFTVQKRRLVAIRSNYQSIDQEKQILDTYLPQYRELAREGVIGSEHRLDWIEAVRNVAADLELPSLVYELSSRAPYDPEIALPEGVFRVYASEMRLTLGLLHEGDLIRLLERLDRSTSGLHTVTACSLERRSGEPDFEPGVPNINAECTVRWLTIHPPDGGAPPA